MTLVRTGTQRNVIHIEQNNDLGCHTYRTVIEIVSNHTQKAQAAKWRFESGYWVGREFFPVRRKGGKGETIWKMDAELVASVRCKRCGYGNPWYQQSRSLNGGKDWVVSLGQEVVAFQGGSPDQLLLKSGDSLRKDERCRKELTVGQEIDDGHVSSEEDIYYEVEEYLIDSPEDIGKQAVVDKERLLRGDQGQISLPQITQAFMDYLSPEIRQDMASLEPDRLSEIVMNWYKGAISAVSEADFLGITARLVAGADKERAAEVDLEESSECPEQKAKKDEYALDTEEQDGWSLV